MDQKKNREGENPNLDLEMERDTEIRRDTQVRGSLGVPPSGGGEGATRATDEAVPEFDRGGDLDRGEEDRTTER